MNATEARAIAGSVSCHAGRVAEDIVASDYLRRGRTVAHWRWRGRGGEIDLIAREGDRVIFVEVKKSRTFDKAALHLGRRQMDRLCAAAVEFLTGEPKGQLTEMRFDLALVDGRGQLQIIENAFGEA
jgi:putative endonuclease